ncbi:MAG: hypothetical protein Q8L57_00640 [bacterium]|nr:hypothetical protein [bacterium]
MKKYFWLTILLIFGTLVFAESRAVALNDNSNSIILTWSSSSFTPAWYPLKPLPSAGSQITVSASPENLIKEKELKLKPRDLTYRWSLNYRVQQSVSGKGKQDLNFVAAGTRGTDIPVKVEIRDDTGLILGEKSLKITLGEPTVQIHALTPRQSLGPALKSNLTVSPGEKVSLIAVPYFFNIDDASQIYFSWTVNDEPLLDFPERPDILEIKTDPETPFETVYNTISRLQSKISKEFASSHLIITVK